MTNENSLPRKPITDSPWFWAYVFATAALVALFLMSGKYDQRQSQIERQFSARQSHGYTVSGSDGPVTPPESGQQMIQLGPIYLIFGGILIIAWLGLWYRHFRRW